MKIVLVVPALSIMTGLLLFNLSLISAQVNEAEGDASQNETESAEAMPMVATQTPESDQGNDTLLPPSLIIRDVDGIPCLLAVINATVRISYRVRPSAVQDSYIAITEEYLPESMADVTGECGDDVITVAYDWNNSTFQVNLVFKKAEVTSKDKNTTTSWSLDNIEIQFDLSQEDAFPGAKGSEIVTVSRKGLGLFKTAQHLTMLCAKQVDVQVGKDEPGVNIIFNHVQLAAFGLTSEEFPQETVHCIDKSFMRPDDDIVVPLIVACSLSLVVILVVIAYAISRKIQEARDQTQYKPMP